MVERSHNHWTTLYRKNWSSVSVGFPVMGIENIFSSVVPESLSGRWEDSCAFSLTCVCARPYFVSSLCAQGDCTLNITRSTFGNNTVTGPDNHWGTWVVTFYFLFIYPQLRRSWSFRCCSLRRYMSMSLSLSLSCFSSRVHTPAAYYWIQYTGESIWYWKMPIIPYTVCLSTLVNYPKPAMWSKYEILIRQGTKKGHIKLKAYTLQHKHLNDLKRIVAIPL